MTSNPRHGLPPRLMAHQPTRFATAQESKPSPSPGIRMTLTGIQHPPTRQEGHVGLERRPTLEPAVGLLNVWGGPRCARSPPHTDLVLVSRPLTTRGVTSEMDASGTRTIRSGAQAGVASCGGCQPPLRSPLPSPGLRRA